MLAAMDTLDLDDSRPSYLQVADRLRAAILDGRLAANEQLPTQKTLAGQYGVAVETVKRALGELRSEGLIVTRQGKGSYVRSASPVGSDAEPVAIVAAVAELRDELDAVKRRLDALEADPER